MLYQEQSRTDQQREIAERRYDEIVSLSDVRLVQQLERERDELWPLRAERVPALEAWLRRAQTLALRLPEHRITLQQSTSAQGYTRTEWELETLGSLIESIDVLQRQWIPEVQDRLSFANTVEAKEHPFPAGAVAECSNCDSDQPQIQWTGASTTAWAPPIES